MKKKIIFLVLICLPIAAYFIISSSLNSKKFLFIKNLIPYELKQNIKKKFFPYEYIETLELKIQEDQALYYNNEINLKKNLSDIKFENEKNISLFDKNLPLKKFTNLKQLTYGIQEKTPGSAYLEFYNDKLFLLSSTGIIGFSDSFNKQISFKQIENNISNFINEKQFKKGGGYSTKDLYIFNDNIYVSFIDEIKNNCYGISIIQSDLNFKRLNFKKIFQLPDCITIKKNVEFSSHQSGGKIVSYDKNNIFFTTGDFRQRSEAQNKDSLIGKILKININNGNIKIISKGHRNPQGLYYDKSQGYLISTEHGPMGGDEINLIELGSDQIPDYGWPISSYGEHYGGKKAEKNKIKYEKYPLLKSHKKYGFIEPLKYFAKAVAPSEVIGLGDNKYIMGAMKDKSIYTFELNEKNIINLKKVEIGERVRDVIFNGRDIYLFLEDTASIGIINYK